MVQCLRRSWWKEIQEEEEEGEEKQRRNHEILQFVDFVNEEEVAGLLLPFL